MTPCVQSTAQFAASPRCKKDAFTGTIFTGTACKLAFSASALILSAGWALPAAAHTAPPTSPHSSPPSSPPSSSPALDSTSSLSPVQLAEQEGDTASLRAEMAQMRRDMAAMAVRLRTLQDKLANTEPPLPPLPPSPLRLLPPLPSTPPNPPSSNPPSTPPFPPSESATSSASPQPISAQQRAPMGMTPRETKSQNGWSYKPRGRLQFDAGTTNVPNATGRSEGFGNEVRRARLGLSGDMTGGFGYKVEVDFAGSDLSVTDAILTYKTGDTQLTVGQFNPFQSLEELTSSLHTSFIERAAFTDAFGFERRMGAAAQYKSDILLVQTGVFTDNMDDLSNKNWGADGRIVAMPKMGDAQLHLGASAHYNDLETGSALRYRQRPLVHFTSERFINTGSVAAQSETGFGLEGAVIAGPFHAAGEAHWQHVDRPGIAADPTFFGGSIEAGLFLSKGDTRSYSGGKFGRVKPANPVTSGGIGSIQLNLRYDFLTLNDAGIIGGKQNGYMASLIWKPTDYVLFLANYGRLDYQDAAYPEPSGNRDYAVDVFALRAQVDF